MSCSGVSTMPGLMRALYTATGPLFRDNADWVVANTLHPPPSANAQQHEASGVIGIDLCVAASHTGSIAAPTRYPRCHERWAGGLQERKCIS